MKIWPWELKISDSFILYLYTHSHLSEHQNLPQMCTEYRFNQQILKSGATSSAVTNRSYGTQIARMCPLILGDRMNLLLLTEPAPTNSLGWVKVSQQIDAERCD